MAKKPGRALVVRKGGTVIASVRTTSVKVGREFIDVTDADSGIFREYLADAEAGVSMTLSVAGLGNEELLKDAGFSTLPGGGMLTDVTITDPTASTSKDVIAVNWAITEYEVSGEYQGAVEFSATLESSGAWTRT